jgi:type I restriction enzyme S subunit
MIGRYGPPVFQILRGLEGSYNVALMKAVPVKNYDRDFVFWLLKSPKIQADVISVSQRSAGQSGVNLDFLNSYRLPLPPKREQERIVNKIESCFSKIDATEDALTKAEALIEKYRESLLAKAFRGELSANNSSFGMAKLPVKHEVTKAEHRSERKINGLPELPQKNLKNGWIRCYLGEVCDTEQGVQIPKSSQILQPKTGYKRYLYISDFSRDSHKIYVRDDYKNKEVKETDIVMVNTGNTSGRAFTGVSGILSNNLFRISPKSESIDHEFLFLYLSSPVFQNILKNKFKQSTQPHLGHKMINSQILELPPLKEQVEIVSIANKFISQLDNLAEHVGQVSKKSRILASTILTNAFSGKLVNQVESEGTGHQLLEEILAEKAKPTKKSNVEKKIGKKKP